jgi:hypothetical protein
MTEISMELTRAELDGIISIASAFTKEGYDKGERCDLRGDRVWKIDFKEDGTIEVWFCRTGRQVKP